MFKTPQTITLSGTQLELSDTTGTETITGPKAGVTVSGNNASRVFQVDPNVTASISGLTISGGSAASGGGLANYGTTTLTNCTVSGNSAIHQRRRPVQRCRHDHADQLHRQRQLHEHRQRKRRRRFVQPFAARPR